MLKSRSIRLLPAVTAALLVFATPAVAFTPTMVSPTSFWSTPLPANVLINSADTMNVGPYLATDNTRSAAYLNTTHYTAASYVVPTSQPLVPVRLRMASGATTTPPYAKALEAVFLKGLPIPSNYVPQGDTDDEASFFMPSWTGTLPNGTVLHGRVYEAWRLRPNTDPNTPNIKWEAQWGGRMSGTSENPGHFMDRFTTYVDRTYPNLPTDPVKADLYEEKGWGSMATSLPLQTSIIKAADVQAGVIKGAIGLTVARPKLGFRWPAMRADGSSSSTSPVQEGMRLRLPAGYVAPANATPFLKMVINAVRDYGFVVTDTATGIAVRAEPAVRNMLGGVAPYQALKGFPWASLQVLATGTDAKPNP
jgi:hypothetical protein